MREYKKPALIFENVGAEDEDMKYDWHLMQSEGLPPVTCDFDYIGDDGCSGPPRWLCTSHDEPEAVEFNEYFCWHHAAGILMDLEGVMS